MPAESAITPLGWTFISWMPLALQRSPDHRAVAHCQAKELERLAGAIDEVRDQFFPQRAERLLGLWERILKLTVEPAGLTLEERRLLVIVGLRKQLTSAEGRWWVQHVGALAGPGWSYAEHVPGDPTSPPEGMIRVEIPYPPESLLYQQLERLIREITPAHLDLIVTFTGGFVLDRSQLDQEEL